MSGDCYIRFYPFRKLQGWRWWGIVLCNWSTHTHAQLEFDCKKNRVVFLTLDGVPTKVFKLGLQTSRFLGKKPYLSYSVGKLELLNEDFDWVHSLPTPRAWKLLLYHFVGRFVGMRIPDNCITFICDFLNRKGYNIPRMFSPKELWRYLHDGNNVSRTSPSGQDNAR